MRTTRGLLRADGQEAPADVHDVEEDVRTGVLGPDAELQYAPWTGDAFVPVNEIVELRDAFDAPDARLTAHLERGPLPWASSALTLTIAALGLAQLFFPDALPPTRFGVSLDDMAFGGRWWSPWTSQFSHAGSSHLMGNLAVIGYSGYRVEKALGPAALATVAAATLLVGTLAVLIWSPATVIGGSMLAYGLLGAHITTGFRFGDAIPRRLRVRYGFGVLPFFAIPFAGALGGAGISHSAHLGGLLGGGLAALMVRPESIVASAKAQTRALQNLVIASALTLVTALPAPLCKVAPRLVVGPTKATELPETGVVLPVPLRLRAFPVYTHGAPGWRTSRSSPDTLFGALQTRTDAGPDLQEEARLWSAGNDFDPLDVAPLREGWRSIGIEFDDDGGRRRAVEHMVQWGHYVLRLGYSVAIPQTGENPREELFQYMIQQAEVGRAPDAQAAADAFAELPKSRSRATAYGEQLHFEGAHAEAEAVLGPLHTPGNITGGAAMEARWLLWSHHPGAFLEHDDRWIDEVLAASPRSTWYQGRGIRMLVDLRRCSRAAQALASYEETAEGDLGLDLLQQRVVGCVPR